MILKDILLRLIQRNKVSYVYILPLIFMQMRRFTLCQFAVFCAVFCHVVEHSSVFRYVSIHFTSQMVANECFSMQVAPFPLSHVVSSAIFWRLSWVNFTSYRKILYACCNSHVDQKLAGYFVFERSKTELFVQHFQMAALGFLWLLVRPFMFCNKAFWGFHPFWKL